MVLAIGLVFCNWTDLGLEPQSLPNCATYLSTNPARKRALLVSAQVHVLE